MYLSSTCCVFLDTTCEECLLRFVLPASKNGAEEEVDEEDAEDEEKVLGSPGCCCELDIFDVVAVVDLGKANRCC